MGKDFLRNRKNGNIRFVCRQRGILAWIFFRQSSSLQNRIFQFAFNAEYQPFIVSCTRARHSYQAQVLLCFWQALAFSHCPYLLGKPNFGGICKTVLKGFRILHHFSAWATPYGKYEKVEIPTKNADIKQNALHFVECATYLRLAAAVFGRQQWISLTSLLYYIALWHV